MKTREFEKELAHIRDEFERLRLAYEGTRAQLEAMEVGCYKDTQFNYFVSGFSRKNSYRSLMNILEQVKHTSNSLRSR